MKDLLIIMCWINTINRGRLALELRPYLVYFRQWSPGVITFHLLGMKGEQIQTEVISKAAERT